MKPKQPKIEEIDQWGPVDFSVLYPSFWFYPSGPGMVKKMGVAWPPFSGFFKGFRITFLWYKKDMQRQGETAIQRWLLPEKKFARYKSMYTQALRNGKTLGKKISQACDKNAGEKTLNALTNELYKLLTDFWVICLPLESANFAAPEFLKRSLPANIPAKDLPHVLETLLAPELLSFHQQEELELLLAFLASKDKNDLEERLKRHAQKWYWVENGYLVVKTLAPADFKKRLKNLSKDSARIKIRQIQTYAAAVKKNKKQILRRYQLPAKYGRLASRLAYSIWWQDHRKGRIWEYIHYVKTLSEQGFKFHHVPLSDLLLYNAEEWRDLHHRNRRVNKILLKRRLAGSAVSITPHNYCWHYGKTAQRLRSKYQAHTETPASKTLRGITVSKGQGPITGRVKIILSTKQGNAIKRGEILVAPMTSPDYVPLMRKAAAIITDVGGLMSHAAVVSRELSIPCIVNTKLATKIFKNGDKVIINTESGTVTKL